MCQQQTLCGPDTITLRLATLIYNKAARHPDGKVQAGRHQRTPLCCAPALRTHSGKSFDRSSLSMQLQLGHRRFRRRPELRTGSRFAGRQKWKLVSSMVSRTQSTRRMTESLLRGYPVYPARPGARNRPIAVIIVSARSVRNHYLNSQSSPLQSLADCQGFHVAGILSLAIFCGSRLTPDFDRSSDASSASLTAALTALAMTVSGRSLRRQVRLAYLVCPLCTNSDQILRRSKMTQLPIADKRTAAKKHT